MKARASFYAPDALPDITALMAAYERLLGFVRVLVLARDFSGCLKMSLKLRRAAKALMAGRARAAAIETKWKMLLCPDWRARVISDLGGRRKLRLWDAAMKRAIAREHDRETLWKPPAPQAGAQIDTPQSYAARIAEIARRAHIRKCAQACANPQILKDPFRVDQDGLFRLAPVPRAPASGAGKPAPRDYVYEARKFTNLTGYFAPATLWPVEIYAAERMEAARSARASAFALGKTPGSKRRPARRHAGRAKKAAARRYAMPARRRILAPPQARF